MTDVFISYKREQRDVAMAIAEALAARGYSVWWDIELLPGDKFSQEIGAIIDKAKSAVVLWSEASVQSSWVISEAQRAFDRDILIPIRLDSATIPLPFNSIQTHDLSAWSEHSDDRLLEPIFAAVERLVGRTASTPVASPREALRAQSRRQEIDHWRSIVAQGSSKADLRWFIQKFPDSELVDLAEHWLKQRKLLGKTATLSLAALSALAAVTTILIGINELGPGLLRGERESPASDEFRDALGAMPMERMDLVRTPDQDREEWVLVAKQELEGCRDLDGLSLETCPASKADFNVQSNLLATIGADEVLRVWALETEPSPVPSNVARGCRNLSWSPSGSYLAAICENEFYIWSSSDFTEAIWHVASQDNGKFLWNSEEDKIAVQQSSRSITLYAVDTGQVIGFADDHNNAIYDFKWSPIEDTLLTTSLDYNLRLFSVTSEVELERRFWNESNAYGIAWVDEDQIISGGTGQNLRLWSTDSNYPTREIPLSDFVYDDDIELNAREIQSSSSADTFLVLLDAFDLETNELNSAIGTITIDFPFMWIRDEKLFDFRNTYSWSPDGNRVLLVFNEPASAEIWDTRLSERIQDLNHEAQYVIAEAWVRDGAMLYTLTDRGVLRAWRIQERDDDHRR